MPDPALTDLVPAPAVGRVHTEPVRTGIDEATASGRIRLDAIARWLQDAAYWDLVDAGWPQPAPWFVRRLRLRIERFPIFAEALTLATWCSGLGPAVAERRTSIRGAAGARAEAVAQWIHVDPATQRPAALPERFMAIFAPSAQERRSRTRLRHPAPPEQPARGPFTFRAADTDPAGHVNNAAYWAVLEEDLVERAPEEGFDAEIEHRGPLLPGVAEIRRAGALRWVVDGAGTVAASFTIG